MEGLGLEGDSAEEDSSITIFLDLCVAVAQERGDALERAQLFEQPHPGHNRPNRYSEGKRR